MDRVGQAEGVRVALTALGTKLDGTRASAATIARKRAALSGALNHAVEVKYLPYNPLRDVRVKQRLTASTLDPRVVVNPIQARALLGAVLEIEPTVHALFRVPLLLRPAEARNLRNAHLIFLRRVGSDRAARWLPGVRHGVDG